jgi:maltose alpha-D-glucosyltransferase / alpha-amylase
MVTLHNFSGRRQTVGLDPKCKDGNALYDVFDDNHSQSDNGTHQLVLGPYAHRWYRVGAPDNALNRARG